MKEVLIATNNAHKVEEIRTALNFEGWTFTTLAEAGVTSDPAVDADSFEGNARIKARAARAAARESLGRFVAVLADDSGLEVDALDGAPGVFSARYAGPDGDDAANNAKLLAELAAVPDAERTARMLNASASFILFLLFGLMMQSSVIQVPNCSTRRRYFVFPL